MTHTGQESQGCASGSVSHTYVLSKSASWAAVKGTLSWGLPQSAFIHVTISSKWVGKFRRRWNGSSAAECRKLWRGRPAEQRKPRYRFNYDSLIMGRWMPTSFSLAWSAKGTVFIWSFITWLKFPLLLLPSNNFTCQADFGWGSRCVVRNRLLKIQ